jgi:predicted metalloprotease
MRWEQLPDSENVEDRRDARRGPIPGLPIGRGGLGIGTIVVLGLIGWALGIDPRILIGGAELITGNQPQINAPSQPPPGTRTGMPQDQAGRFVGKILASTEVQWKKIFAANKGTYVPPKLVLFRENVEADACGFASAASGPFYCPGDQKIYLDTSFFRLLETRLEGCPAGSKSCEFAQAYVIAHEVGHHVQFLLKILQTAREAQRAADSKAAANRLQVQVELQADCFAGIWAYHAEEQWKLLQPGDVEAALKTAAAIGDDMLQRKARGQVVPDSFTHGTSEQRQRWFTAGLKSGTVPSCNTFGAKSL